MEESELVWLATYAFGKNLSYEKLGRCDYMYGKKEYLDDVWEYYTEIVEEGLRAFSNKYKHYKLY